MTHWENFPTLPRSYAGHAEIKYLVANFHLQRRARGQGVSLWVEVVVVVMEVVLEVVVV